MVEQAPPVAARRFRALVVLPDADRRARVVGGLQRLGAVDVAEAASVDEARVRASGFPARELVVVDAALPDGSGLGLVSELRAAGWTHGIVLSSLEDPYTVRAALAAGVRGFLTHRSGAAADAAVPVRPRASGAGVAALSAREVEVLALVADGRSNRDVGERLGLSALTVKSHLARIARKLGTGDRAEMVVLALRADVIP